MHEGRVPLHTLRANIDYGFAEANTIMGKIGIKTWIYKGDIFPDITEANEAAIDTEGSVGTAQTPAGQETPITTNEEKDVTAE